MHTCATYKFFMRQTEEQGLCRRKPPVPLILNDAPISIFPPMLNEGWCGEHFEKDNEE